MCRGDEQAPHEPEARSEANWEVSRMPVDHPLHRLVADEIGRVLGAEHQLLRDPACGGNELLSLFLGPRRSRETRMCCVDALVVSSGLVRVIVEIEESGFLPTKICGKVLQAALATHYIGEPATASAIPYGDDVLFVQVLDGSKLREKTRKKDQARLIEHEIQTLLPMRGITHYQLFHATIAPHDGGLAPVGKAVVAALT